MIGLHLIIDAYTEDTVSAYTVEKILLELPTHIDMHILDGPHIVKGVRENPGYTGIEVIDKSHISIHTFSENNTISIDIYSCKPFNAKKVVEYLKEKIKFNKMTARTIKREII